MNISEKIFANAYSFFHEKVIYPLRFQKITELMIQCFLCLAIAYLIYATLTNKVEAPPKKIEKDEEIKDIFKGTLVDGKLQGKGEIIHPNGVIEKGHFVDGLFEGKGKVIAPDGAVLIKGLFKKGNLDGEATINYKDYSYKGDFQDHLRHGKAEEKIGTETYIGDYKEGKRDGVGKLAYAGTDGAFVAKDGKIAK